MGSHPKPADFLRHSQNLSIPAASQVITIRLNDHKPAGVPFPHYDVREVYMNDGSQIKASTSALFYNGTLLVGTVFDNLLVCEVLAY